MKIAHICSRIEEMSIPIDEDARITTREAHFIQAVGDHEPMSVTRVAAWFKTTKSAASQMAVKLAHKGFMHKKRAVHSNKEYALSLTSLGRRALVAHERFHHTDLKVLAEILSGFSLSQIATLSVLLKALANVMEQRLAIRESS